MKFRVSNTSTAAACAVLASLSFAASATPAQALGSYNIMIDKAGSFTADYCLLTTTSGNGQAACTGARAANGAFRLGTVHNTGDRVWIDINVVLGKDRKGIDLQGKHYIKVGGDVFTMTVCGWKSQASYQSGARGLALHGNTTCAGAS
ncbi:hypothetical protein [Streptomyces sp. DH12]|uniref:hypothetical protein n=1 Tax=Streptomyces sp. DH12 TaxID=2857010 RepID=UPI001E3A7B84|nr:hypothetical protein [Streptomyces sp. DH12]